MNGKYECDGVGNLLDIYGLAVSMGIELKENNRKKTKRALCDEINKNQDGFKWLNSVAKGAKPYFDEERQQTMIMIAYDYFAEPSPQPAIEYLYIHHTEGEPFMKDDIEMIKVRWSGIGFDNATDEPTQNILDAGYESKKVAAKYTEDEERQMLVTETSALEQKRREIEDQKVRDEREKERAEKERVERERVAKEQEERERAERERVAKEQEEKERAERERAERERVQKEEEERKRAEKERLAKEAEERQRVERERVQKEEEERKLAEREKERVVKEAEERQRKSASERKEKERVEKEKAAQEEKERAERERIGKERAARLEKERAEKEAKQRRDKERQRQEQEDKIEQERKKPKTTSSSSTSFTDYTPMQRPASVNDDRRLINQSIAPCVAGKVDRFCLTQNRNNRYVDEKINSNMYGTIGNELLGAGTYGKVYKTDKKFAIKCLQGRSKYPKQLSDNDVREMCWLRNLYHPNVLEIYQVGIGNATDQSRCKIAVAMKLFSGSLNDVDFTNKPNLRSFVMYQVVRSVAYIHSHAILHRDIKPHNFLFDIENNQVVLADFGTSQGLAIPNNRYSSVVTTTWFRAPEIFLDFTRYDSAIDIWSIGASWLYVLHVENLHLKDELSILEAIFQISGYPSETNFPEALAQLAQPKFAQFETKKSRIDLRPVLKSKGASDLEIDLILKMLTLNPKKRITAYNALGHAYFNINDIKSSVERKFFAAPIVPTSLTNCGALLIAMQKEAVGNYLKTNEEKIMLKHVFKWITELIKTYEYRGSLFFITTSICHRYIKQKEPEISKYFLIAAASMDIAWKLDADYTTKYPFSIDGAVVVLGKELINTNAETLIAIENDILMTLDMDFDRPTAFTILEFLASHRIIGDNVYIQAVKLLDTIETDMTMLTKTSLETALFVLKQLSITTECKTLIEKIYPEFSK